MDYRDIKTRKIKGLHRKSWEIAFWRAWRELEQIDQSHKIGNGILRREMRPLE
jgi:hypothetical protein